jgi:hypothetical protein
MDSLTGTKVLQGDTVARKGERISGLWLFRCDQSSSTKARRKRRQNAPRGDLPDWSAEVHHRA